MIICRQCNTENSDDARYCRRCGARFNAKRVLILIICIGLLFLICGVSYYVSHKTRESDNHNATRKVAPDTVVYDEIEKMCYDEQNHIWYRYKINGLVGALDENKKIIVKANYDVISFESYIGMFCAIKDNVVEILKKDGSIFIPISRNYEYLNKENLENGEGRYYYIVWHKGLLGVCDRDGNEIIPPRFATLYYEDKWGENSNYDSANPIVTYGSFMCEDNDKKYYFDIYIDQDGSFKKLEGKKWERLYECSELYSMEDASCMTYEGESTIRCYGDYLMIDLEKYNIINDSDTGESLFHVAIIDKIDDGGYAVDDNIRMFVSGKYIIEWHKIKDIKMSDFYGTER